MPPGQDGPTDLRRGRKVELNPVREAAAQAIKELIWRLAIRIDPAKPPIFLYASRRSGSTLLMEAIGTNRGVLYSDQPFCIYKASEAQLELLPIFPAGQFAAPDTAEESAIMDYTSQLLSGSLRVNWPWRVASPEFHFRNNRLCLKITDAKSLIDWFDTKFELSTVVMTRHPIAQAVSVAAIGWMPTGKGLLRNPGYVKRWLNHELTSYSRRIYQEGSELEQRVLDWSLENIPMLSQLKDNPHWFFLTYEDLVEHPLETVEALGGALDLPDKSRMIKRLAQPSSSMKRLSTETRRQLVYAQEPAKMLDSWRLNVTDREVKACFEVLERFGLDLYGPDDSRPVHARVGRQAFA
jgi:hypothetical protein